MAKTLIDLLKEDVEKAALPANTLKAQKWIRRQAQELAITPTTLLKSDYPTKSGRSPIGRMYCFYYSPKASKTLSWFDRFPLIIPVETYSDGFLGLNLHYLPPDVRTYFLSALEFYRNNPKYDESTRIRLSYQLLKNAGRRLRLYPLCLKRYLHPHIQSRIVEVPPSDWHLVCLLPVERFKKATARQVYKKTLPRAIKSRML